jgi:glycerol-1-phosphate dehydrogenase [NAD(P)+]
LNTNKIEIDRLESKAVIELPRIIDIKLNAIDNIGENCEKLLLKDSAVLIVDDITYDLVGKRVEKKLIEEKIDTHILKIKAATMEEVENAIAMYKEVNAKFSVAAGGGTVIDVAKYSSFKYNIPFVSIPTAASHDGISSARASIKGAGMSHSFEARPPMLVVGDVETLSNAPKRFAISGAGDLLSNKTAVLDWELSQRITGEHVSEYASALSRLTADAVIKGSEKIAKDPIARTYIVFKGLISSSMAMCIAGSSRPSSGAEHLISHRLDSLLEKPAMHGEQVGLATILSMYLHGGDWDTIRATLKLLESPVTAKQIGADESVMMEAIITAQEIRPDRYTILSAGVTKKAIQSALEDTSIV